MLRGDPEPTSSMEVDYLSLTLPTSHEGAIELQDATIRSVDRSTQLLVVEVNAEAIEGTALARQTAVEAGASVVVRTVTGRTYEGYVEVVAETAIGRIYWCGADC